MVQEYLLSNPHIELTSATSQNPNQPYIIGMVQNVQKITVGGRERIIREKGTRRLTIFKNQDEEFVTWLRSKLPSTGTWKDADGKDHNWNGLRAMAAGEVFDQAAYDAVCKEAYELGFTDLFNGKWVTVPFEQPMVQQYSSDLGGHRAGEWVTEKGSKQLKVYKGVQVFVRVLQEGATFEDDQAIAGWDWMTARSNSENRFKPLADVLRENGGAAPAGYELPEMAPARVVDVAGTADDEPVV